MEQSLISRLTQLGFTQNESKAYIALLKQHPATGYEISQQSGVPRSAIYDVLKRLELNGIVSSEGTRPVYYIPIDPEQLSSNLASQFEHNIQELKTSLAQLGTRCDTDKTWNIKGYRAMIDQARSMIDQAQDSIYFSIWNREYDALRQQLENAIARNLNIHCFSFTHINNPLTEVLSYDADEEELRKIWQRQMVIIIDKKGVLIGGADNSPENRAIRTDNPAVVKIALNHLILDITLLSQRKSIPVEGTMAALINGELEGLEEVLGL